MATRLYLTLLTFYLATFGTSFGIEIDDGAFEKLIERIETLEQENVALKRETATDMAKLKAQYDGKIANLEKDIRLLQKEDVWRNNSDPYRNKRLLLDSGSDGGNVAFTAAITPAVVPHHSDGQTIVFDKVVTNVGGAYSSSDGIFVAPVQGIYIFSCSLLEDGSPPSSYLHAEITVNGVVQARVLAHGELSPGHRDQGSQTIIVQINQGDHVRVRHVDEDDGNVGGELYSTFSGCLLWATE